MLITNREKGLERIFSRKKTLSEGARKSVEDIIARVRADGDAAIAELTEKFDGIKLTPENMRLTTLLGPRSLTLLLNRGTRPLWQNCKTSRFTEAAQSVHFNEIA